jgi:hypothetical protein
MDARLLFYLSLGQVLQSSPLQVLASTASRYKLHVGREFDAARIQQDQSTNQRPYW